MKNIEVRVDDRLIHGQTIVAWCPTLKIEEIIAVDDASAKNPTLKSIMTMGVPKNYKTSIVTIDEAKEMLRLESDKKRLVIVKFPQVLMKLSEEIQNANQIILGNLAKKEDSIHRAGSGTEIYYLSNQDVENLQNLVDNGLSVKFQQLPSTTATSWEDFKKTIK